MQLQNFIMLKIFLTAVATGAVTLAALNGFGLVKLQPKAALYAADALGGVALGIGIALAGACPGTVLAQIGAGYRDALFTVAGGLAGALAYSYAQPALGSTFLGRDGGKIIFTDLVGIPYWTGALGFAAILVVVLWALERWRPWRQELGRNLDGNFGPTDTNQPPAARMAPVEQH
jgi:uncharacterized protein